MARSRDGYREVALRAARRGAVVTGADISEPLLEQARRKAASEGVEVDWQLADAQRLPFDDAGFNVVSSCFGVIFAPDPRAVGDELARVCRTNGRLGLATWKPDPEFDGMWDTFVAGPPPFAAEVWGEADAVEALLGGAFELEFDSGTWILEADSLEAFWEFVVTSVPPVKALHGSLEPERRLEMRRVFLDAHRHYGAGVGPVSVPRDYLLVVGRRR